MNPQTRLTLLGVLSAMVIVFWVSFYHSSPDIPNFAWDEPSSPKAPPRPRLHDGDPFPAPVRRPVVAQPPVAADHDKPKPPPRPDDPMAKTAMAQAAEQAGTVPGAGGQDEPLPELPSHVTGKWTDELHEIQSKLVVQLAGSPVDQAEWRARYQQHGAPPPAPADTIVRRQLRGRECCNALLPKVPSWTRADLLRDLKVFIRDVYPNRPVRMNTFGMRLSHAFGCWFLVKALQPKYILESGVHKGQSTWLMRQAAPHAKIIAMDPRADMVYWDKDATYYTANGPQKPGYDVRPFTDFAEIDWSFIADKREALILWDDHQNEFKRILKAYELGFIHMLFDDNWSPLQGDNYSLKQVCDESGGLALRPPGFPSTLVLACDQFHMNDKFITIEEHKTNHAKLISILDGYYETPPILFVPPHMLYTPFGHKPTADKSAVEYVMPRPSARLLRWMCESLIPPPLVQSQSEFDDVGMAEVAHSELWFYMSLGYARFRPAGQTA